uniref:Leucine-rich repeat-containing N-terminal plant-type domain-containing protein n=1 Tax=Aegilops tauschii subsp. strangulata TaxID=200361 RepID=A0A453E4T2_AEGTS
RKMSFRSPRLHFTLLLLTCYCSIKIAANGGNRTTVQCLPNQASSLLQLKHSFLKPNLSSWQQGTDCCHWEGVGCDRASGRVITLDLSDRNLQSTSGLSLALFNLTSLTNLSLSDTHWNWSPPKNLRTLDLPSHTDWPGYAHNDLYLRDPSFQTFVSKFCNLRDLYLDNVQIVNGGSTWSIALADSVPLLQNLIEGSSLGMLKLRDNHLHGILPENIGEGCMLQTIDLNNNQIEGKIPRSLCNCRNLEVLDIGSNQILDTFPSWLGEMSNLRILILRSNQLYGSIGGPGESDASSKGFSALQIIDLASNNFSGNLSSKWFDMLQRMTENSSEKGNALAFDSRFPREYYQERLTFKGIDLTFTKILTTFKMLDFSNNTFDGPMPDSIGNLIALHGLNMSHNAFTGRIPSKLGDLAQLESLDLSRNKLSGEIPRDLTSLTYLAVLNLSYNNLTGMIPEGQQFSLFTNSSFEGNEGLCGKPLSKQCNSSGTGTLNSSVSSQDSVGTIVLFVFVGSGFGVGFAVAVVLSVAFQAKRWNCNRFRSTSK